MKIVYCGRVSDAAGVREADVDPPSDVRTASALRDWLGLRNEALRAVLAEPSVRIVVNDEIVSDDRAIRAEDEVAFIPPVSGG